MDVNEMISMLPQCPRYGMISEIITEHSELFGGGFLIYSREAVVEETVEMRDEMDYKDLLAYENGLRHRWAASCACTKCGETWLTEWGKGGRISLYETVSEGDTISCPYCDNNVTLVRRKNLRHGRTFQLMAGSVENVGDYTAVLFWLVSRRVEQDGEDSVKATPFAAVMTDRDGTPRFFSRARYVYAARMVPDNEWRPVRMLDALQVRYYSYEAVNRTKVGGWMWRNVPDTTGKTGEKTGLADYIRDGGVWPVLYLLFWRRHPAIENVIKSGWTTTVDDCIEADVRAAQYHLRFPKSLEELMNWEGVRPRDILGMSRKAAAMGRVWQWDSATLSLWREILYFGCSAPEYAEDFQRFLTEYGYQNMNAFVAYVTDGWSYTMSEIDPYLKRQRRKYGLDLRTGMEMFFDYRTMLDETLGERTPSADELWPKNLRAAHDRITAAQRNTIVDGFDRILKRWGALEWTDGECRAVLPRCAGDLIDEGHTLRHCVGTYAGSHAKGKIIVFIRHYRRPERSWFTLNEDLTGDRPRRIQLHGYGNEYANGKRLTIPKKVLDFCDRWERDVLLPLFRDVQRQEAEAKASRRTKAVKTGAAP